MFLSPPFTTPFTLFAKITDAKSTPSVPDSNSKPNGFWTPALPHVESSFVEDGRRHSKHTWCSYRAMRRFDCYCMVFVLVMLHHRTSMLCAYRTTPNRTFSAEEQSKSRISITVGGWVWQRAPLGRRWVSWSDVRWYRVSLSGERWAWPGHAKSSSAVPNSQRGCCSAT